MTIAGKLICGATVLALCISASWSAGASPFHVVDGDTIRSGDTTYRLYGIDAPEQGQPCNAARGGTWPCGKTATARMNELIIGRMIVCDNRGLDDYGRTLAVCTSDGREINATMVRESLAWAFRRYADAYNTIEDQVRPLRIGIWQANTQTPWDYRYRRWQDAKQQAPKGCPIKGNINGDGERIYHAPWSPWYARTRVNEQKGERWFCDEGEATRAGWRAPMWGSGQ